MNTYQAKRIPLRELLASLGHQAQKETQGELWYLSPFRQESAPSFKINVAGNVWYDFGMGKGGNIIDFAMHYFHVSGVAAALHALENQMGNPVSSAPSASNPTRAAKAQPKDALSISKIQPLQNRALLEYLSSRGIDASAAGPYVQEVYYTRAGKHYFALAFPNQSGGWELRNPYYKGSLGSKDISIIHPQRLNVEASVMVFEGFMDFLSFLAWQKRIEPPLPVVVLNSTAMGEKAIRTLQNMALQTVYLYLDHDASGRELTAQFQRTLTGLNVVDQAALYAGHKDFNEFLQHCCQRERS